ncbi:hypothetical protein [Thalassospira lucentensis]|uniref:hypothetical protein n=1 Tax=Thalassospira lucentensis TaxID=168935 RepID=UPI00142E631F|nr:hypothetical protein [Thalassospira lucentensis]NIZ00465.1 hypothetical protein [Thalassospira lucentensis]
MGESLGGPYPVVPDWPGRNAGNSAHARITALLLIDIGQSLQQAMALRDRILDQIAPRQGNPDENEIILNAYAVYLGPKTSVIEAAFDETGEAPVEVLTADLLAAIEQYIIDIERASRP